MLFRSAKKRTINIFFASAYFPVTVGTTSPTNRLDFYLDLEHCIASCSEKEILLIGADCNLSMGTRSSVRDAVLGPFGHPHRNKAGTVLYEFCTTIESVTSPSLSPVSFRNRYDNFECQTSRWANPQSKLGHQIDLFLTKKSSLSMVTVTDAGCLCRPCVDSDH